MTIKPQKILILAANPKQTVRLRLDEELRDIQFGLQRSLNRDKFDLRYDLAVRPRDIRRAILDYRPNIIHFSGHGAGVQGLAFEDETGNEQLVTGEALAGLFGQFSNQVECVLLNACYSEVQADAIVQHINYVIGMNDQIQDNAAIEFVVGFYDALLAYIPGYDSASPVEFAFDMGLNAIPLAGLPGELIPQLKKKQFNSPSPTFRKSYQRPRITAALFTPSRTTRTLKTQGTFANKTTCRDYREKSPCRCARNGRNWQNSISYSRGAR